MVYLAIHIVLAVTIIALILMQHGKGADSGATFGSGSSQTMFGSQGSASFLSKMTGVLVVGFFATSLILGQVSLQKTRSKSLDDLLEQVEVTTAAPQAKKIQLPD